MKRGKLIGKLLGIALTLLMIVAVSVISPPVRAQEDVVVQFAILLDSSGSIGASDWKIMVEGLADAVENSECVPHNGSVELTVVRFANEASTVVGPVVITSANAASVASIIRNIAFTDGATCISCAFEAASAALAGSPNFHHSRKQAINLVTDGQPHSEAATETARDDCIATLQMTGNQDVICSEVIGDGAAVGWLLDEIVFPQPGCVWPATFPTCSGWVRQVANAEEFADTICEKLKRVIPSILDHFKCYPNHWGPYIGEAVHLEDQFSAFNATIGQPVLFANPVEKWHDGSEGPIEHPDHHFTFYRLDYVEWCEQWSVDVDNQFGRQNLTLSRPVLLAVPTQKIEPGGHEPPVGLDHFLLYEVVEGTPVDTAVGLVDQFFEEPEAMVGSPIYFANPVRKTHAGNTTEIENPEAHLVFYEIGGAQYIEPVLVLNQFGDTPLILWRAEALYSPSEAPTVAPRIPVYPPELFLLGVPSNKVDFTVQYSLTITSTSGGSVTQPGEGTFWYEAGTVVNLVASPSSDRLLVSWVGDVGTVSDPNAASTNISVHDCYTITASFRYPPCGLSTPVDVAPLALVVMGLVAVCAKRRHGNGSRNG